ncbi:MAG: hypothetical protein ABIP12_01345, partial [Terriglobales bacterium]
MPTRTKHFALSIAVAMLTLTLWAQQPPAHSQGTPQRGPASLRESVSSIQERQKITPPGPFKFGAHPKRNERRRDNPQNPAARPEAFWPPRPSGPGIPQPTVQQPATQTSVEQPTGKPGVPSIYASYTIGTSFTGATLSGTNPTFAFPPDSMGAVGPTQYIVAVNGRIVSFNKTTGVADGVINATTNTFFNSVRNASGTSDPRIRYDRLSQRWFVVIINVSTPNRILIAVSNTSTITLATIFTFFFIPIDSTLPTIPNTCLADYPTLGIDANALYIGTNNFCGSPSQTYHSSDGYVIRKSDLLAGTLTVTPFR